MNRDFLIRQKIYIKKNIGSRYYDCQDYNYNYHGKYKFMDKKLMGNLLAYTNVPLFIFSFRKQQVSNIYYGHSNEELLSSLPRDIIKDYSNSKLSYFDRLNMNELEYAKSLFYNEYNGGDVLFTDSKVELSLLPDLII